MDAARRDIEHDIQRSITAVFILNAVHGLSWYLLAFLSERFPYQTQEPTTHAGVDPHDRYSLEAASTSKPAKTFSKCLGRRVENCSDPWSHPFTTTVKGKEGTQCRCFGLLRQ
jgi:hypothetical protein